MNIFVPKEVKALEKRVALSPDVAKKLIALGCSVFIEKDFAIELGWSDALFEKAGVSFVASRKEGFELASLIFSFFLPEDKEISLLKPSSWLICFSDPVKSSSLSDIIKNKRISIVSMQRIPRTTLAQKMDALSSQANLAGYVAVIQAANISNRILPMMTTAAGTIKPASVFIIGAGVAGLQAIATAKRLGASVSAYDTRPAVKEQIMSLGAKFIDIDLGKTADQKNAMHAKALTDEQMTKQREIMTSVCARSNIIITTAQVLGRKPPLLIDKAMIKEMKSGTVIIDMAAETGGNVEGSCPGEIICDNGVSIVGSVSLASEVPVVASETYANNLYNYLAHFWDSEKKCIKTLLDNDIMSSSLYSYSGEIK